MAADDLSSFKNLFLQTSRDHLKTLEIVLGSLQKEPSSISLCEQGHIAAHSLKGESLAMGYMTTGALARLLERVFWSAKEKAIVLNSDTIQEMSRAVASLFSSINAIEQENKETVLNDALMSLEKVSGISANESI